MDTLVHARSHGHVSLRGQLTQGIWPHAKIKKYKTDLRCVWSAYHVTHTEMMFERGRYAPAHHICWQNSRLSFKRKRKAQSISSVSYLVPTPPHLCDHSVLLSSEAAITPCTSQHYWHFGSFFAVGESLANCGTSGNILGLCPVDDAGNNPTPLTHDNQTCPDIATSPGDREGEMKKQNQPHIRTPAPL